ncbi:MAG TPA: transglutaminase-like domain-containing protein [Dokdonella sp.]|uniref:transglutaminase-like domain-containing protein n=1 Tax=Dokdonella sp. TaxID=2291710 RepID=UPI002D80A165|nr:transglutaminase-like domain-containing protein [Dokdonella sp.]HET9032494.1 transglutaminase-like domain-containing protein [Dokdonella sp.]
MPQSERVSVADVITAVDAGQFDAAEAAIALALADTSLDASSRESLVFERERMRRILLDFTLDEAALKAQLRKNIPDLTDADFANWKAHGLFEQQSIDGRVLYFNRAASNLFRLSAEALARRSEQTPLRDGPMETANAHHREILAAAGAGHARGLASRKLKITQSLSVHADAVPAGEIVRAWIPYPRALPGKQDNIQFIASTPGKHVIAPESALQRTVYLEQKAEAGKPTAFSISYELTVSAQSHAVDADKVISAKITPELAPFVAERPPHIVFNESLRLFSRQIVGDEKNPWRIAQKLYAAVDQIPWAGAREYSTISNISDYALHAGHADCGQQTLLLMALLRLNGIPSRWQSGMVYSEGNAYWNLHDWGQLYIAPYGWIPMDVTTGRLRSDDPRVAGFYLGGLDAYRIAFNDDYGREFVPAKKFFRSETVDLQRGEAEWSGGNLYFNQWDYDFVWQVSAATP